MFRKIICMFMASVFAMTSAGTSYAQNVLNLPAVGASVNLTKPFSPVLIKGISVDPQNAMMLDFIVDPGEDKFGQDEIKVEATRLIKYFMASLAVPEDDLWVNLSPYEKDRIVPTALGETEMGRDMLAQDYLLKQIAASLMNPDGDIGRAFWEKVYAKADEKYGTIDIPVDTFNKVWIMPARALVYQNKGKAVVIESRLKVMLDSDYWALSQNADRLPATATSSEDVQQILREIIIPVLEEEVNTGKTFAPLRQIYHSLILAHWFRNNLKQSILNKVYTDQDKIKGVDVDDKEVAQKIYKQYVASFKKGVYDYIKEEKDPVTHELVPRKYFSGGVVCDKASLNNAVKTTMDPLKGAQFRTEAGALLFATSLLPAVMPRQRETVDAGERFDKESRLRDVIAQQLHGWKGFYQYKTDMVLPSKEELFQWFLPYFDLSWEDLSKMINASLLPMFRMSLGKNFILTPEQETGLDQVTVRWAEKNEKNVAIVSFGPGRVEPGHELIEAAKSVIDAYEKKQQNTDMTLVVYDYSLQNLIYYQNEFLDAFEKIIKAKYPRWQGHFDLKVYYADLLADMDHWKLAIGSLPADDPMVVFWRNTWVGSSALPSEGRQLMPYEGFEARRSVLRGWMERAGDGLMIVEEYFIGAPGGKVDRVDLIDPSKKTGVKTNLSRIVAQYFKGSPQEVEARAQWFLPYVGLEASLLDQVVHDGVGKMPLTGVSNNFRLDKDQTKALWSGAKVLADHGVQDVVITTYGGGGSLLKAGQGEFEESLEAVIKNYSLLGKKTGITLVIYDYDAVSLIEYSRQFDQLISSFENKYPGWRGRIRAQAYYGNLLKTELWPVITSRSNITFWRHTWVGDPKYQSKSLSPDVMKDFSVRLEKAIDQGVLIVEEGTVAEPLVFERVMGGDKAEGQNKAGAQKPEIPTGLHEMILAGGARLWLPVGVNEIIDSRGYKGVGISYDQNGFPVQAPDRGWQEVEKTSLETVERDLELDIGKFVSRAKSEPDRHFVWVDWGCGDGTALNTVAKMLDDEKVDNVSLVGFGNMYSPAWQTSNRRITFIWDTGEKFPERFKKMGLSIDLLWSRYGVIYIKDLIAYIREIGGILAGDGEIFLNSLPSYNEAFFHLHTLGGEHWSIEYGPWNVHLAHHDGINLSSQINDKAQEVMDSPGLKNLQFRRPRMSAGLERFLTLDGPVKQAIFADIDARVRGMSPEQIIKAMDDVLKQPVHQIGLHDIKRSDDEQITMRELFLRPTQGANDLVQGIDPTLIYLGSDAQISDNEQGEENVPRERALIGHIYLSLLAARALGSGDVLLFTPGDADVQSSYFKYLTSQHVMRGGDVIEPALKDFLSFTDMLLDMLVPGIDLQKDKKNLIKNLRHAWDDPGKENVRQSIMNYLRLIRSLEENSSSWGMTFHERKSMMYERDLADFNDLENHPEVNQETVRRLKADLIETGIKTVILFDHLDILKQVAAEEYPEALHDQDMAESVPVDGGIDLKVRSLNLEITGDTAEFKLPENLNGVDLKNIEGLMPVIMNITPITNMPEFLGLTATQ